MPVGDIYGKQLWLNKEEVIEELKLKDIRSIFDVVVNGIYISKGYVSVPKRLSNCKMVSANRFQVPTVCCAHLEFMPLGKAIIRLFSSQLTID